MNGDDGDTGLGWPELIGFMATTRLNLARMDPEVHPMTAPRLAASPAEVEETERRLGARLDPAHRDFLLHADGWSNFFLDMNLLGCRELGQGEPWARGREQIDLLVEEGAELLPPSGELLPVAVGTDSADVHAVWLQGPRTEADGLPVLWLANEEIDRWPDFTAYFRSVYALLERFLAQGP